MGSPSQAKVIQAHLNSIPTPHKQVTHVRHLTADVWPPGTLAHRAEKGSYKTLLVSCPVSWRDTPFCKGIMSGLHHEPWAILILYGLTLIRESVPSGNMCPMLSAQVTMKLPSSDDHNLCNVGLRCNTVSEGLVHWWFKFKHPLCAFWTTKLSCLQCQNHDN